jgi:3-dehydroquinate synthase
MGTFRVELGTASHNVVIGSGLIARLGELMRESGMTPVRAVIVTDANVMAVADASGRNAYIHPAAASMSGQVTAITVPAGEATKSLAGLESLYRQFAEAQLDRTSVVIAIGGGVVGDLAGFAAATYLRGLPLVQVPTTLLAQVDSSLGGKTAINLDAAKNLVGAFYQPRLIVADIAALSTLPEREFREGLAEVIKYGAIMDAPFIAALERDMPAIIGRDPVRLAEIVERSLRHKAAVVQSDEREGGLRKILNFGHTIGHALEASAGYGNYLHGEAIAIGMTAAALLSSKYAGLSGDDVARLTRLIEAAGLPTAMPEGWRDEGFMRALMLDKKRAGNAIEFVLLDRLGHALTRKLSADEIAAALG